MNAEQRMRAALDAHGWTLVEAMDCPIQGVLLRAERPVTAGETFLGLPLAGPTTGTEVIERHYCPQAQADPAVQAVTWERACTRMRWAIEQDAGGEPERTGTLTTCEMGRVAVLYAFRQGGTFPIGVAIEYAHQVTICVPAVYRFPAAYRKAFVVGCVDRIGARTVVPGDREYFELVLEDVQRTFPVRPIDVHVR